jgi:putative endonuclease
VAWSKHFVYMVRCADGTLYTGYARNPQAREKVHNAGRGAKYTAGRRPVLLVFFKTYKSVGDALRAERQLKRRTRDKKEALVTDHAKRSGGKSRRGERLEARKEVV